MTEEHEVRISRANEKIAVVVVLAFKIGGVGRFKKSGL